MTNAAENNVIELEDVFPDKPEFTLESTEKTYKLRLFSLADRSWLEKNYPGKELKKVLNPKNPDYVETARIVYHQMEDKSDFLAERTTKIDDDGVEQKYLMTGPAKLLDAIKGLEEMTRVVSALTRAIVNSEPKMKDHIESEIKKKMKEANEALHGPKSLMQSKESTDGQTNIS